MAIDFGPASHGIGIGFGMIGMGIGLKFMSDTVHDMKRSTKHRGCKPKTYVPRQYKYKPLKWKL